MIEDVFSMLLALVGTICVLLLTYYCSKWYARRMRSAGGGKHIKTIDRLIVGRASSIIIIEVEGTQYMVGVTDSSIQMMKQLETPISHSQQGELQGSPSFLKALKTVIHKEKVEDEQQDRTDD